MLTHNATHLEPLDALYEAPGLPSFDVPDALATAYGGSLGFTVPRLFANFVASVDGVVAIPDEPQSSHLIGAASQADRFVMGLLRSCADAVLIGSGTMRASPRTRWTADHAYWPAAELYAELRRQRGRSLQPTLAILSGSGRIDPQHPGLRERTLVLTSKAGAERLDGRLPRSATVVPIGQAETLEPVDAVEALRATGHQQILCEGGPHLFAGMVADGLVDELFLTISPLLAGRASQPDRPGLVEGVEFLPGRTIAGRLLSLRRWQSHLFLRYELPPREAPRGFTSIRAASAARRR
jgi:riboflavin biosynthesis pyrimidine reductase